MTNETQSQIHPAGTLGDWFNLSASLGSNDQESLALEACLHGLAQQAGRPFIVNDKLDWPKGMQADRDLIAHAMQFAASINSPLLPHLMKLSGYPDETSRWDWRSYIFAMEALVSQGKVDAAIKLGKKFDSAKQKDERVSVKLARIMHGNGQKEEAIELLKDWLQNNKDIPSPQTITALVDWVSGVEDDRQIVSWTTRGIRDLAMEQPTASLANMYLVRGLAYDRLAHKETGDVSQEHARDAIRDLKMAASLGITDVRARTIQQRILVLQALTGSETNTPDQTQPEDEFEQTALKVMHLLGEDNSNILEETQNIISNSSLPVQEGLAELLIKIAKDDEAPNGMKENATSILQNLLSQSRP